MKIDEYRTIVVAIFLGFHAAARDADGSSNIRIFDDV